MFGALPQGQHSPFRGGFGQLCSGVSVLVPRRLCPENPTGLWGQAGTVWAQWGLDFLLLWWFPPDLRCCLHPWGSSGAVFVLCHPCRV